METNETSTATLLIESQHVGNIHYYARMLYHGKVLLEQEEHWLKASYRNRCYIALPDGALRLSVPIEKGRQQRRPLKDIKIAYTHRWRSLHWTSLCTAYRSSPYFEYYEDDLAPLYEQKFTYLVEFNQAINQQILSLLQISESDLQITPTQTFQKVYTDENILDFRSAILPQQHRCRKDELFTPPVYHQVFENKTQFIPNLSIYDLMFAEGPNTVDILRASMQGNV